MDVEILRWSQRYLDERAESGFLNARQTRIASSVFWCCVGLLVWNVVGILMLLRNWPTSGNSFKPVPEAEVLALVRNYLHVAAGCICLVCAAVARSRRCLQILGTSGIEAYAAILASIAPMFCVATDPWYMAAIGGCPHPETVTTEEYDTLDVSLLLVLHALTAGVHVALPVRWFALIPFQVMIVLLYGVPAFVLGSPSRRWSVLFQLLCLMGLVLFQSYGKRSTEFYERHDFTRVRIEKSLRFQMERHLETLTGSMRKKTKSSDDSEASSNLTASKQTHWLLNIDRDQNLPLTPVLHDIASLGTREHWLVPEQALCSMPDCIVGYGGFGLVMLALLHGAPVALKAARQRPEDGDCQGIGAVAHELAILRRVRHPNIVLFHGACILPCANELLLVLEYIRGLPLQACVCPPAAPSTADRCKLASDVCCALRYLHAQMPAIVHGDLKGANVLVERVGGRVNAKLVDFGLSRMLTKRARPLGGTLNWRAPELFVSPHAQPTAAADVFSFGRLLYLTMTGNVPLQGYTPGEIRAAARSGHSLPLAWPKDTPLAAACEELGTACLQVEPVDRPDIVHVQLRIREWLLMDITQSGGEAPDLELALAVGDGADPCCGLSGALASARRTVEAGWPREKTPSKASGSERAMAAAKVAESVVSSHVQAQGDVEAPPPPDNILGVPWQDFKATPDLIKDMTITATLRMWNVLAPTPRACCCPFHAALVELQHSHARLVAAPCDSGFSVHTGWQCPSCHTLHPADGSPFLLCLVCGYADHGPVISPSASRN